MAADPLISIIIPFYKTDTDKLSRCINSVLSQTYQNFEALIVDDGSGDSYSMILGKVQSLDTRIRIYRKKDNMGLSAARNYGLLISKGKYILFIDSDDLLNSSSLQNMYLSLLNTGSDMVIGELKIINDYNKANYLTTNEIDLEVIDGLNGLERLITNTGFGSTACGRLASKTLWLSNGMSPFKEGVLHEDLASMWKIIMNCHQVCLLKGEYYYYYQGGESNIHQKKVSIKFCQDYYNGLRDRNTYLGKKLPLLKSAIGFSYLTNIPLIYMYTTESEIPKKLQPLRNELISMYRKVYSSGIQYPNIRFKNKIKFILFKWCPSLYSTIYKRIRKFNGYRL